MRHFFHFSSLFFFTFFTAFFSLVANNWRICDRSLPQKEYNQCIAEAVRDAVVSLAGGKNLQFYKIISFNSIYLFFFSLKFIRVYQLRVRFISFDLSFINVKFSLQHSLIFNPLFPFFFSYCDTKRQNLRLMKIYKS